MCVCVCVLMHVCVVAERSVCTSFRVLCVYNCGLRVCACGELMFIHVLMYMACVCVYVLTSLYVYGVCVFTYSHLCMCVRVHLSAPDCVEAKITPLSQPQSKIKLT